MHPSQDTIILSIDRDDRVLIKWGNFRLIANRATADVTHCSVLRHASPPRKWCTSFLTLVWRPACGGAYAFAAKIISAQALATAEFAFFAPGIFAQPRSSTKSAYFQAANFLSATSCSAASLLL